MTHTTHGDQILIQDSKGRVRTPRWRQEMLLAEYEKSGMSGAAFAEHVGVKYTTLASWIQKKRGRAQAEPEKALRENQPVQWVEAVVAGISTSQRAEESGTGLMIRLGGGALMEIADSKGAILAAEVLRHLGEAR
jgi:lambda repressor-like predicted transcriptional regulator